MKQFTLEEYQARRLNQNKKMRDYYISKKKKKLEIANALAEKKLKKLKGECDDEHRMEASR